MRIRLGEREVGTGVPCLVVADIGSNHDGSLARACALVDAAADAGVSAVAFQSFRAATLVARRCPRPDGGWKATDAYALLERLELRAEWHAELRTHAHARGLCFLSTPLDEQRAALLAALGVPAFPVAAGDLTHLPLLRTLGGFGRPLLLRSALATVAEIDAALAAIGEGAGAPPRRPPVVLVHGPSADPAPAGGELRTLETLGRRFDCPVGWTDRAPGHALALGAVALGAPLVEKLLTDDRGRRGPDHATALEPRELRAFVAAVGEIEPALAAAGRRPGAPDDAERRAARRSVYAVRALPAGAVLEASDLKVVRPALGAPPAAFAALVGRRLVHPIAADQPVRVDDVA